MLVMLSLSKHLVRLLHQRRGPSTAHRMTRGQRAGHDVDAPPHGCSQAIGKPLPLPTVVPPSIDSVVYDAIRRSFALVNAPAATNEPSGEMAADTPSPAVNWRAAPRSPSSSQSCGLSCG